MPLSIFGGKRTPSAIDTETTEQYEARRAQELSKQKQDIDTKYTLQPSQYRKSEAGKYDGLTIEKGQIPKVEMGVHKALEGK